MSSGSSRVLPVDGGTAVTELGAGSRSQAHGQALGWAVHAHAVLGSTSDEARRMVREGAPCGTTVWARTQTAGRGRRGRTWASPEGNLHMSVVLGCAPNVAPQLGFVAALAVADAVDEVCGSARTRLKWPNDVMLDGAKLAGLLLEVEQAGHDAVVVLGIGVNLAHSPPDAGYPATSLRARGVEVAAETMLRRVLRSLGTRLDDWDVRGFEQVLAEWAKRGHRYGDVLRVGAGDDRRDAIFTGLGKDGSLVTLINGRVERFTSAEIVSG